MTMIRGPGRSRDRISQLPDCILEYILTLLPLKLAIRTSVLSQRWRNLWHHTLFSAASLEFGDEFACNQSAADLVSNLNRYLQLHGPQQLYTFRVFFAPLHLFHRDIEGWVAFAAKKEVRELHLDLSQGYTDPLTGEFTDGRAPFPLPPSLFECRSLIDLKLSRCNFPDAANFPKFSGIQSLSLWDVNITSGMFDDVIADCPLLEILILRSCRRLTDIHACSQNLRLKRLVVADCDAIEIVIFAPLLESFHYYGKFCETQYLDISSLVDALISSVGREQTYYDGDFMKIADLRHVHTLTLCTEILLQVTVLEEWGEWEDQIELPNLVELQILMEAQTEENLYCFIKFMELCRSPQLQKLFIKLPHSIEEACGALQSGRTISAPPPTIVLTHLKWIKVTNFKGTAVEMWLIKLLLENAALLEHMILVAPPTVCGAHDSPSTSLKILRGQVGLLPLASPRVCIKLCHYEDEDSASLNPAHMDSYCDEIHFSGRGSNMFRPMYVEEAISALI